MTSIDEKRQKLRRLICEKLYNEIKFSDVEVLKPIGSYDIDMSLDDITLVYKSDNIYVNIKMPYEEHRQMLEIANSEEE